MAEAEEALYGRELPGARRGGEPGVLERVGPILHVLEREPGERRVGEVDEGPDVALVGVAGVGRLAVEPEPDEVGVVVGLRNGPNDRGGGADDDGTRLSGWSSCYCSMNYTDLDVAHGVWGCLRAVT